MTRKRIQRTARIQWAVCGGLAAGLILSMVSHGIDAGNVNRPELFLLILSLLVGGLLGLGLQVALLGLVGFITEFVEVARHSVSKPPGA